MTAPPPPSPLSPPARYFPVRNGRYDVSPALFPLGHDFGNGPADARLFQMDREFARYRANKSACRAERFGKYVCEDGFDGPGRAAVCRLLRDRMAGEYPGLFAWEAGAAGGGRLTCRLSGESLRFDDGMSLNREGVPGYADAFDALCCQVPEDVAVVRRTAERGEWIAALHLCAPSHWAAEAKIGRNFAAAHAPVPGFGKVAAASDALTERVLTRGPFVRFTWGVSFDDRLNCHPDSGRAAFDPESLFLRVERQGLWGLPDVGAYVFTIRVYLYPLADVRADAARRDALLSALRSMSPEARRYKGVDGVTDRVLAFLAG